MQDDATIERTFPLRGRGPLPARVAFPVDCACMVARTLVQRFVGDIRLVVRRTACPTAAEFDAHVSEAVAMAHVTRAVLVVYVGDGADLHFDSEQRAKLSKADMFLKQHAVLAPSIRPEVVLSMRWLGAQIRTFEPDAFEEACDFLEVDAPRRPQLHDVLVATKALVDPASFDGVATHLHR